MIPATDAASGGLASAQARATRILLAVLTGVAIYLCWRVVKPFANVILWSVVLALLFAPLNRKLLARTQRPNLAAALTLLVAVVSVLLPLGGISLAVVSEVSELAEQAPERWHEWVSDPLLQARVDGWRARLGETFPGVEQLDNERIKATLTLIGEAVVKRSVSLVRSVLRAVLELVFIVFSLFYLLRDAGKFERVLRRLLPLSTHQSDVLLARTAEVVHASVFGVVAIALLQGTLGGAIFAILGLPSPLLWGVVMAFFAMIPMVGAGVIWLPAAILLLATGHTGKAIALCAVGALLIGTIDNFLRPRVVGGRTRLHELVIFFAVLGSFRVFGVVGLFVGPAIFAVAWSLLELFRESTLESEEEVRGGPEIEDRSQLQGRSAAGAIRG